MKRGALIAAAAAWILATSLDAQAQEPILLGMSSPQTGGAAYLGQHQRWGAELAIEEINGNGGVLGRPLELRVQDNQCNPSQGAASAEQLLAVGSRS